MRLIDTSEDRCRVMGLDLSDHDLGEIGSAAAWTDPGTSLRGTILNFELWRVNFFEARPTYEHRQRVPCWVFIAVAVGGTAVTIYARIDDCKRGRRIGGLPTGLAGISRMQTARRPGAIALADFLFLQSICCKSARQDRTA
jgi:hypothetical protein